MARRDLDVDPDTAIEAVAPELPENVTPAARARELERDLKLMGPINPLALQEFDALTERHEFLKGQLDDIKASRRELNKVIKAIDEEIVTVFASAYADVADNFTTLFERLFPGGEGRLRLTEPNNFARHRYRGQRETIRQERQEVVASIRWRALTYRTRVLVRRLPQPPLTVLCNGRGRSCPRRREPPPVLEPC